MQSRRQKIRDSNLVAVRHRTSTWWMNLIRIMNHARYARGFDTQRPYLREEILRHLFPKIFWFSWRPLTKSIDDISWMAGAAELQTFMFESVRKTFRPMLKSDVSNLRSTLGIDYYKLRSMMIFLSFTNILVLFLGLKLLFIAEFATHDGDVWIYIVT